MFESAADGCSSTSSSGSAVAAPSPQAALTISVRMDQPPPSQAAPPPLPLPGPPPKASFGRPKKQLPVKNPPSQPSLPICPQQVLHGQGPQQEPNINILARQTRVSLGALEKEAQESDDEIMQGGDGENGGKESLTRRVGRRVGKLQEMIAKNMKRLENKPNEIDTAVSSAAKKARIHRLMAATYELEELIESDAQA